MIKFSALRKYLVFLSFVVVTVVVTYFTSATIASAWYILLLAIYSRSKDEAFWLAFFFVTTDGFMGFLGLYTTVISAIPGLPAIELSQFYILLTLVKVLFSRNKVHVFYGGWMSVMLFYTLFLVLLGIMNGLEGESNIYFRIVKVIFPFLLFYTIPRLLTTLKDYEDVFRYLFLVLVLAFVAQMNAMFTGFDPQKKFRLFNLDDDPQPDLEVGRNFRILYNQAITFLSLFGALYFLVLGKLRNFKSIWLYLIMVLSFAMSFLSATRGYILGSGLIILLFFLFVEKLNVKRVFLFSLLFAAFILVGFSNEKVSTQIQFTIDRLLSLSSMADGDMSAGGTLIRLNERGPHVIQAWSESPILGSGFSNHFIKNSDFHVGNQNILLHAGIVGFVLMCAFFFYFVTRMLGCYFNSSKHSPYSSTFPVFVIFLLGWIIIHSTSSQQFAFYGLPNYIFPQAIFLSLAGFTYREYHRPVNAETHRSTA